MTALDGGATEISIVAGRRLSFANECSVPTGMLANVPAGLEPMVFEFGAPVPRTGMTRDPPATKGSAADRATTSSSRVRMWWCSARSVLFPGRNQARWEQRHVG